MNIEELKKSTITYNNTTFIIKKLNADEAWNILESIRIQIIDRSDKITPTANNVYDLIKAVLGLPTEFVQHLKTQLFLNVTFTIKGKMSPNNKGEGMRLSPEMMASAFSDLEAYHIYELLARCLVVNFFYSFDMLLKTLQKNKIMQDLKVQNI